MLVGAGLIERLRGCERAEQGGLHRAQSVWRLRVPDSVSRRHSGRDRRPGMVRESPSQIHCDTGDTLLHTPLFGRGLQPGSPLSAITVVCSSASSKVCVSAMLRNSLFLRKRSGSLRTSHPTPGGMSSATRTEAGGFFVSGVTISLLRSVTMWGRHAGSFLAIVNRVSYSGKGVGLWSGAGVVGRPVRWC